MIYFVTGRTFAYDWNLLSHNEIVPGPFDEFVHWVEHVNRFGLDTETTMIKDSPDAIADRDLLVIQIGNENDQWVIDFIGLPHYWLLKLKNFFSDDSKEFLLHNANFDLTVLKSSMDIMIENVHDTFLMIKILETGLESYKGRASLAGCLKRFFDIEISKDAQTTFTGEPLTVDQIKYAAIDVVMLEDLFELFKKELEKWELWYLYNNVERHVVKAYVDMQLNPMRFDTAYWRNLAVEFDKEDAKIEAELNQFVFKDPLLVTYLKNSEQIIKIPLIQPHEQLFIKWASPVQKKKILNLLVPSLPDNATTKPEIKKFTKKNEDTLPESELDILKLYLSRKYDKLNEHLVANHYNWLIDNEFLIKEGTVRINWGSNVHKLLIFQFYYPKLINTDAKALARIKKNELISKYKEYSAVHKTVTTYGHGFINKYVNRDGMIAPSGLKQILNTGRIALIY